MHTRRIASDPAISTVGSYLATKAMEQISMKLRELESKRDREREDGGSPRPPYRIAADKTTRLLGLNLDDPALDKGSPGFHYGLAGSWAPLYTVLRRRAALGPLAAGLVTGGSMPLLIDEGLTPALGFSAPNRAYPLATHARGVVAHLALGPTSAAVTDTAWAVLRLRP
jgi:hypothetical protein